MVGVLDTTCGLHVGDGLADFIFRLRARGSETSFKLTTKLYHFSEVKFRVHFLSQWAWTLSRSPQFAGRLQHIIILPLAKLLIRSILRASFKC